MTRYIIIDTNILWEKEDSLEKLLEFKSNKYLQLKEILKEILKKDYKICIPEIVKQERIYQRLIQIKSNLKNSEDILNKISLGKKKVNIANIKKINHKKELEQEFNNFVESEKIELISLPKINSQKLIKRALNKTPPFEDKGRGFKDTLVWLSILNYKNNDDKFIFLTEDGIFNNIELIKEWGNKNLIVFAGKNSLNKLKEYLKEETKSSEEEIIKNEQKTPIYSKYDRFNIEEKIKEKIPEIMFEINKQGYDTYGKKTKYIIEKSFSIEDVSVIGDIFSIKLIILAYAGMIDDPSRYSWNAAVHVGEPFKPIKIETYDNSIKIRETSGVDILSSYPWAARKEDYVEKKDVKIEIDLTYFKTLNQIDISNIFIQESYL